METPKLIAYIAVMASITYLIRMLPLTLLRRKIDHPLIRSFLQYMPYAVLTAMIIPDMLFATASFYSAALALGVGIVLALWGQKLPVVALGACTTVFFAERLFNAVGLL